LSHQGASDREIETTEIHPFTIVVGGGQFGSIWLDLTGFDLIIVDRVLRGVGIDIVSRLLHNWMSNSK
jgi:hypothetical protein